MDTTTKLTATHKLLHAAMATMQADDGLEALDNLHVLDAYPDGLTAEAEATFEMVGHVGMRNPSDRELLMATLLATQAAQIEELRTQVAHLQLEKAGSGAQPTGSSELVHLLWPGGSASGLGWPS